MNLKLIKKKEEAKFVYSFFFSPESNLTWKAGQFLRYTIPDPNCDQRQSYRYFTIASSPFEKDIMLTTKFAPDDGSTFKKDLRMLSTGDNIEAAGPGGDFVIENPSENYCFIAGGIGITPFRSILLDLDFRKLPVNVALLYANRTPDFIFKQELEEIKSRHPEFKIHYFVDPQRIDAEAIRQTINDLRSPIYYISGPEPMVEAFEAILYKMGVPKDKVKRDYFPGYTEI